MYLPWGQKNKQFKAKSSLLFFLTQLTGIFSCFNLKKTRLFNFSSQASLRKFRYLYWKTRQKHLERRFFFFAVQCLLCLQMASDWRLWDDFVKYCTFICIMYETCRWKRAQIMKPYDVSLHRKHWKLYICLAKDCKSISTQPCLDIRSILAPQMSGCEKVSMLKQYVFKVGFLRRIPYSPSSRSRRGRRKHVQPHHQGVNWAKLQAGDSMCICLCVYLSLITRQCSLQASAKSRLINNHHHGPQTPVSSTETTGRLKTSQKNMLPKDI